MSDAPDFFVASNIPHDYPLVLQKPATASATIRETAETYILDSGIGDDTDPHEILGLSADLDADFVIADDELHDQAATTRNVRRFEDLHADHETDATLMTPLQPPHAEHYRDLADHSHYCLGGMAGDGVSDEQAVRWIRAFRQAAGPDPYVHALGIGGGIGVVRALAGTGLVDSVDAATPEVAAFHGDVLGPELRHRGVKVHSGEGNRRRVEPLAEFNCWQTRDVWQREATDDGQQTLTEATV
jgi:hypothetical protein